MSRIEQLEQRLAADPNSRMFVQLAEEYRKAGLLDNAIEVCEEGLKKHPDYPSAQVALGRALLEAESYDRACEQFEAVLAKIPDNILANKFLGETYHRLGRYEDAIKKYEVAHTLAPEDAELDERIRAVRDEMAGGGPQAASPPSPPAAAPQPEAPPSPPPMPPQQAVPPVPPASESVPPTLEPAAPREELEPTLVETPAEPFELEESVEPEQPAEPEEPAPIPLVSVDEPMVLEERSYNTSYAPPPQEESSEDTPPSEDLPPIPLAADEEPFEVVHSGQAVEPAPPPPAAREADVVEPIPPPSAAGGEPDAVEPFLAEPEPGGTPSVSQGEGRQDAGPETPTMAEIYASQGHFEQAMTVYRNLLAKNPQATQYEARIEELSILAQAAAEVPGAARQQAAAQASPGSRSDDSNQKTIEVLEQWLSAIRKSRGA